MNRKPAHCISNAFNYLVNVVRVISVNRRRSISDVVQNPCQNYHKHVMNVIKPSSAPPNCKCICAHIQVKSRLAVVIAPDDLHKSIICTFISAHIPANVHFNVRFAQNNSPHWAIFKRIKRYTPVYETNYVQYVRRLSTVRVIFPNT